MSKPRCLNINDKCNQCPHRPEPSDCFCHWHSKRRCPYVDQKDGTTCGEIRQLGRIECLAHLPENVGRPKLLVTKAYTRRKCVADVQRITQGSIEVE